MRTRILILAGLLLLAGAAAAVSVAAIPQLRWRAEVVRHKLSGALTDLSWSELARWLPPGSPVYLAGASRTGNAFQSIVNMRTSDGDVERGRDLFRGRCVVCHGADGQGDKAPALTEPKRGSSDWAIFRNIRRGIPGTAMVAQSLSELETWQVLAFLRKVQRQEADSSDDSAGPASAIKTHVPYDRVLGARGEAANWLTYSGTYDSHRHSSLDEIDRSNVWRLRLEWMLQFDTRQPIVEATPIVVDGVMYVSEPPNNVHAVDARDGRILWSYVRALPEPLAACCGLVNRGVAVLDGAVYVATLDAHLVALDARDGHVIWDVEVGDHREGYSITGAPLAVKDMIITGVSGGEYAIRGVIDAYDARDGTRRWRFHTVPGPGEPGHETWAGESWKTGGSPTWLTGSFDPALNLLYWGTGNPSPPFDGHVRQGDNLYSNSVVALDVDTGELRWHFQFTPHDDHDWAAAQIPILVDAEFGGAPRKLMLWANRNGFYYVLDRVSGEFLGATPFAKQTWASDLDAAGRPTKREESSPTREGTLVWPGVVGATNWWSPSFSPAESLVYVPVREMPSIFFRADTDFDGKLSEGEMYLGGGAELVTGEPHYAAVRALDALSGELRWEHRFPERAGSWTRLGGLLSTAGGVVFAGEMRSFYALDGATGEVLWNLATGGKIVAAPVTFEVDGRQRVSVAAGRSLLTFALTPESPR